MRLSPFTSLAMVVAVAAIAEPVFAFAQAATAEQEIIVTGRSLKQTADALADCLARKCPPDEDVAASLAHAENLFVRGDYDTARSTLLRSIGRNRKYAETHPVPVSDLFRANSRVAEHLGESRSYQFSVIEMRDALKKGIGKDDPRTLVAEVELGDSRAKLGFPDEARRIYKDVESRALALNLMRVAMFARLRGAILSFAIAEDRKSSQARKEGRAALEDIIKNPLPGASEFGLTARVMLARADRDEGRTDSTAEIVREFASAGGASRPILLSSQPIKRIDLGSDPNLATTARLTSPDIRDQWADIGFWVTTDGMVSDVEVLRGMGSQDWLKPVFDHLRSRIYAPLKKDGNDGTPGFYMIERYSLTARWVDDVTGSRIRRREATSRIERLDLTPEDYNPPAAAPPAGE